MISFPHFFSASNPPLVDAPQPREEPPPPAVEQMEKELIESEENTERNATHINLQIPVVIANDFASIQPSVLCNEQETTSL